MSGDFDEYRRLFSLADWESIFSIDEIDKITTDISNTLNDLLTGLWAFKKPMTGQW
jgi:hypothetical protein